VPKTPPGAEAANGRGESQIDPFRTTVRRGPAAGRGEGPQSAPPPDRGGKRIARHFAAESVHCRASQPIWGAAMTQDVLGALWFIMLLISIYGLVTGDLCLWRRDN
jgi:hypothetical protein